MSKKSSEYDHDQAIAICISECGNNGKMKNVITIDGQVGPEMLASLLAVRAQVDETADEYEVHINSVGGDVSEGFAIYDYLVGLDRPVTTVVIGQCYSIATIIFLAGEKRLMYPNAELMIHNPWGQAQGDAKELEKYAEWVKDKEEQIVNFYQAKTGVESDTIRSMMEKQTFMNYQEAKRLGFATGKIEPMKAVALFRPENDNSKSKNDNMDFSDEQKTWMQKAFAKIEGTIKRAFNGALNMTTLESGEEVFIEGDLADLVEKQVFQADQETPLADGEYVIQDKRKITVAGGKITNIANPEPETPEEEEMPAEDAEKVKSLEEEIEKLKSQNAELAKAVEAKDEEVKTSETKLEEVQNTVQELKNMFLGEEPKKQKKQVQMQLFDDDDTVLVNWYKGINKN